MELGLSILGSVLLIIIATIYIFTKYMKTRESELALKENTLALEREKFFSTLDVDSINSEIDKMIDKYINKYIAYHFAREDRYIGEKEAKDLIKDMTKKIYSDISPLYTFYISMDKNIESNEDLLVYIRDAVQERALLHIAQINKPR